MAGLFELAGRVFGIRVVERPPGEVETWHPDVAFLRRVRPGRPPHRLLLLGLVSAGVEARRRMDERPDRRAARSPTGRAGPTSGVICGNMTPPAPGPAGAARRTARWRRSSTSSATCSTTSWARSRSSRSTGRTWPGTSSSCPSQIMENWCWEREGLDLFARHFETGAADPRGPLPQDDRREEFQVGLRTMRQIAFAKMDLLMHMRRRRSSPRTPTSRRGCARRWPTAWSRPIRRRPTIIRRFTHIFSDPVGYAAGYYSYKWAEVLDADAFTRFRKEGIFNARVGRGVRRDDPEPRQLGGPGAALPRLHGQGSRPGGAPRAQRTRGLKIRHFGRS